MPPKINLSLIFFCLLSIIGAIIYRIYALNIAGIIASLAFTIAIFFIILKKIQKNKLESKKTASINPAEIRDYIFLIAYLLMAVICFWLIFQARTDIALTSPWEIVSPIFFLFYALATTFLFFSIISGAKYNLALISLHYFLSFSIALIVYQLGYGFDSFIHEATMELITAKGVVTPKPFYYLGFYSLIVIINKLAFIPIAFLNKILVPLAAALTLPILIKNTLNHWYQDKINIELATLFALILPFPFFIVSTPQNLAYLLILLIILVSLKREKNDLVLLWLLALATFFIQPIAGIPALIFTAAITVYQARIKNNHKKILLTACFLALAFALPLAFYLVERAQAPKSITEINNLVIAQPAPLFLMPQIPKQEDFILNFVYLIAFNLKLIFLLVAAAGIFLSWRYKYLSLFYLSSALALFSAYSFTSALPFNYLISYERADYTDRIILLAAFFLSPFILIVLYNFITRIRVQEKIIKIPFFILTAFLILTSLYISYPRLDDYYNSRGISTNRSDIQAVQWIENNAKEDYIVLANQQVSAAALHEFGFKKYYEINQSEILNLKSEIFYYPIPTGGALYQYYLKMVYDAPTRETMLKAMELAGVNTGYLVLNKYWWAFPKLLEEAKMEADNWQDIDNGKVYVFKYIIK